MHKSIHVKNIFLSQEVLSKCLCFCKTGRILILYEFGLIHTNQSAPEAEAACRKDH